MVELLVGRNADVNSRDVDGRTPLHGSIVRGARACDVARQLLSVGADPNAPDNFGYTPLHIAALNEFSACVLLLLGKHSCGIYNNQKAQDYIPLFFVYTCLLK